MNQDTGTSELRELYQEVILDHAKRPRNFREIPAATGRADGFNPLCGDKATVFLLLEGDVVKDVSFTGNGCSISTASASMMTESVKGRTRGEVERLFTRFHDLVTAIVDEVVVIAGATDHGVGAQAAIEVVVAAYAVDRVGGEIAEDQVVEIVSGAVDCGAAHQIEIFDVVR